MAGSKKKKDRIPDSFATMEAAGDFWDAHDLADYPESLKPVECELHVPRTPRYVPLDRETAESLSQISKQLHMSFETLVNVWLKERLLKSPQKI